MNLHGGRNGELIGYWIDHIDHFEGSKLSMHKLFGAAKLKMKIARMKEDKIANTKGDLSALLVGILGHGVLGLLEADFGVLDGSLDLLCFAKLLARISHRKINVNRSPGVKAMIQEEWSCLDRGLIGVVDDKLNHRQKSIPIILAGVDISTEDNFNIFIHPLCLTVSLRMISRGHARGNAQLALELCAELTSESRISVGNNVFG